jgi:hypothetical protein
VEGEGKRRTLIAADMIAQNVGVACKVWNG